jgi:flotillin
MNLESAFALVVTLAFVGLICSIALVQAARSLLYICEPNEVLIFSGRRRAVEGGGEVGYRIIRGGRAWRVPLFERVDRIDLTNMIIDVAAHGAYSKGGIPLNVQGVANIKVAGHEPLLGAAVERLLGKPREDVAQMAKELLEGNVRGVLARLTPEEVNEDKAAFAAMLLEEAEHDIGRLGLLLDTLKIQNISDDRGYLDSLGRASSAEIIKKSRIAEAQNKATAIVRDAENRQRARLQQIEADAAIAVAKAERRVQDARTRTHALVAEERGHVEAEVAKAEAALVAEEARVEQVRHQLEADVVAPARAAMEAGVADARGRSAQILEQGRARIGALEEMIGAWKAGGPAARDLFLLQKLQPIAGALAGTIGSTKLDQITVLPSGDGAKGLVRLNEELKAAVGVDVAGAIERVGRR